MTPWFSIRFNRANGKRKWAKIDVAGFDKEMETQKEKSTEAHKSVDILVNDLY